MAQTFITPVTETLNVPETFTDPLNVIGQSKYLDHNAQKIVTGTWPFAQDMFPGEKLFTGIKFCPYAHAIITGVDTSVAAKMPGVKAVCTYMEVKSPAMPQPAIDSTTSIRGTQSEITYEGVPVAAVAATDPWLAHAAANAITATYKVLPFVTDMDLAMASSAPPAVGTLTNGVWTGTTPNYRTTTSINKGDVDTNMKNADVVYDGTADIAGWATFYSHNTPEPRDATCQWIGDELYVWSGSQDVSGHTTNIAAAMGVQESKLHFVSKGCGGGYGDRKSNGEEAWIAATLAKKAGMPVNCCFSRHVNATGGATHQSQQKMGVKVGCKKDGTIMAIDAQSYGTTGTIHMQLTYNNGGNIRVTGTPITTNVPRTGPFRSVSGMHACFTADQTFDQMAYQLGMDPFDFRMKVAVTPDMVDQATGSPLGTVALTQCLQKCADIFSWKAKFHAPGQKTLSDGRLHGVGSCYTVSEKGSSSSGRWCGVRMAADGTAHVLMTIGAAASGTHTAVAAVVAEALGTTIDKVNVTQGEALYGGASGTQAGSQGTCSVALCGYDAAKEVLGKMMTNAAKTLATTTDKLTSSSGRIFLTSDPTKFVTHAQATGGTIVGRGDGTVIGTKLKRPVLNWPVGTSVTIRTYVAEMAEIAVDTETGQIEILNWVMVDDLGRALHPLGAQAQLNGGMSMQYGFVFGWEQLFDPTTGATINGDFLNQKNPTSADLPWEIMKPTIYESNNAATVYGAMGCGEPPDICYATLHNAFYNATGKRIKETCMYPARVLKALGKI